MKQVVACTRQNIITSGGVLAQVVIATQEPKLIPAGNNENGQPIFNAVGSIETTILHFSREAAISLIENLQGFLAETEEISSN